MYSPILIAIIFLLTTVSSDHSKILDLCVDPVIHSAERLLNDTIRIYKGYHYWDLIGLPDTVGHLDGPHKIWYKYMAPIHRNASTMTALAGDPKGLHYKFMGKKYWSWNQDGNLDLLTAAFGESGVDWPVMPEYGFTAVFHDANASGLGFPIMYAFKGIKVYYFNTALRVIWPQVGNREGYIGGQYGENFPADITSVFSWPTDEPGVKFYVYLFRRDQYCFRPWKLKSGKDCDKWRSNKELFGCDIRQTGSKPTEEPDNTEPIVADPVDVTTIGSFAVMLQTSFALVLASFYITLNS